MLAGCSAPELSVPGPARSWTTAPITTAEGNPIAARLPRVTYRGGPFLHNPRVVTVTFAGDDPATVDRLETFGTIITTSPWWRAAVDAYCTPTGDCIGDGLPAKPVRIDERPPPRASAPEIGQLLGRAARSGRLGTTDDQTLLLVHLPPGIDLLDERGVPYCRGGPRAVHTTARVGSGDVPFAVVPRCGGTDELTATAGHEILEATTNPDPLRRGFAFDPADAEPGFLTSGVEPVDPCGLITGDTHRSTESGFGVQRVWSNRAAALGHHPCVPDVSDQPYRTLLPDNPTVRLPDIGSTTTVTLRAAADRPSGPWNISATDLTGARDGTTYVDLHLDRTTVNAGDRVTLTLTVRALHPSGRAIIGLGSTLGDGHDLWPLVVNQR